MKKTFLLFVLISSLFIKCRSELFAQVPAAKGSWQWVKSFGSSGQIGGANSTDERINMMKTDKHGNTYVCGQVFGFPHVQGLNGGNAYVQINNSRQNYQRLMGFIAKYDCSGNLLWFKPIGDSIANVQVFDMTIDTAGNVYAFSNYNCWGNTYLGDSILIAANLQAWSGSDLILKLDKNGNKKWVWSPIIQFGNASTYILNGCNDTRHYFNHTANYMTISHDTLSMLCSLDTPSNTLADYGILDFNINTGQMLKYNIISYSTLTTGNQVFVGFGSYGNGTFIAASNLMSDTTVILNDTIYTNNHGGGNGLIYTFNRTHFMDKILLGYSDTTGLYNVNFDDLKNGFQFIAEGNRGKKLFNNQYTIHGYDNAFVNPSVYSFPLFSFKDINHYKWGIEADSAPQGIFIIDARCTVNSVNTIFDVNGFTPAQRVKIQNNLFTASGTDINTGIFTIDNNNGNILNKVPVINSTSPNNGSNPIYLSDFTTDEKGNIFVFGNFKNNSIIAHDTSVFFGGNNDMFVIKYGYDCATDSALIAPIASDGIKTTCMVDSVKITWNDNSNIEWGYHIYRAVGNRNATYNLIATLPTNTTIFFDNSISASTNYWYKVAAYNNIGDATTANVDSSMSCKTVGINQVNKNSFVGNIYPNPTQTGEFTLSIQSNETGKAQLQISNYMGQIILDKEVQLNNTNQWHLDLSKYLSGTYLVTLKTSSGNFGERVMVVK